MEETSDRITVPDDSDLTLPSAPRFDAAASQAARSVLPLARASKGQPLSQSPLLRFRRAAKHSRALRLLVLVLSVLVAAIAIGAAMGVYESQTKEKPAGQLSSVKTTATSEGDDASPALTTDESDAALSPSRRHQRISADDDALSMIRLALTDRNTWGSIRHGKHRHGHAHGHHHGHGHH